MAGELIEKVNEQLNCSICLETYTSPKILQCFHVYCQKCLAKLVVRDLQGQLSLPCPICRQLTSIPASGTAGLQSAFHINRLLQILDQHKRTKAGPAIAETNKRRSLSPQGTFALKCSEHSGREVELFCDTCQELLCLKCVVKGNKHHCHDYEDINESFEKYRKQIMPFLEPLQKKRTAITEMLNHFNRHCEEITNQQAVIEAEIRTSSKQLQEVIMKRQDELIAQLEQVTSRKLKKLSMQRNQIETFQAQLSSCLEFTRESLNADTGQYEVLVMKSGILKQVQELTTAFQLDLFTLSTAADMMFSASVDAGEICKNYGRVYELNSPDPSKCVAIGRGTKEAIVGEKVTAVVHAISFKGEPCSDSLMSIDLLSEIMGQTVEYSIMHRGQGQYVMSYQPTVKGMHQLHIKAGGQHIRGSPYSVTVKLPVEKLGTPIQTLNHLRVPWGIAVTGKGKVVVAESVGEYLSVFSPCGEKHHSYGTHGYYKGQFRGLTGVAVHGNGSLLVTDRDNCRIQKFTADGLFIDAVRRGRSMFNLPCDIAYSASNSMIYVADTYNDCIQVLNSDLSSSIAFGTFGSGKAQFNHPFGVTTDNTGRVYVADSWNHRIQLFTAEGKFLRMFGRSGTGKGELGFPCGIAVDSSDLVYVSEQINNRVSVFTTEGRFVMSFGSEGKGPGQFNCPCGLAVDDCGVVYVCDSKNDRVQFF